MNKSINMASANPKERASNAAPDDNKRANVAQALSGFLASSYTLYHKSLFYHWNVAGPNFFGLHTLFEEHYTELQTSSDTIAERIRALGHFSPGTMTEFLSLTKVPEDKKLPADSKTMIANLLAAHETCSREARKVMETAQDAEDEVTHDLMIQRMTFHDKAAWMLRALQE